MVFEEKERKGKKWQRMPSVLEAVDRWVFVCLWLRRLQRRN